MTEEKKQNKSIIEQFEAILDIYMVEKAPFALPKEVKEFIVKVSPYLIIIFVVLALPVIFAALGITALLAPLAILGGPITQGIGLSVIFTAIALIMEVMAVPGLFNRTKASWNLVFYASIVSLIGGILSIYGMLGAIIGAIIGWYILFQVKDMYKK